MLPALDHSVLPDEDTKGRPLVGGGVHVYMYFEAVQTGCAMCDVRCEAKRPRFCGSFGCTYIDVISAPFESVNQPTFYSFHKQQHGRMPSSALKCTSMIFGGRVE